MNPIIERLGEQPKHWFQKGEKIVHPLVERVHERSEKLRQKGTEMLADLQGRQEKLFDRGQQALGTFELNALERVEEVLGWAFGITGEKSEVIKRSRDFISERLEELRKAGAENGEAETGAPVEMAAAVKAEAQQSAPAAAAKVESETGEGEKSEAPQAPFAGYDELGAKKLTMRLAELDRETLVLAQAYEQQTRARKSILEAIERQLG